MARNTHKLVVMSIIPAPGEEHGSVQAITATHSETRTTNFDNAMALARHRFKGELVEYADGWLAPKGAYEWADEHPGKPILAAQITEV